MQYSASQRAGLLQVIRVQRGTEPVQLELARTHRPGGTSPVAALVRIEKNELLGSSWLVDVAHVSFPYGFDFTLRTTRLHTPQLGAFDAGLRPRPFPDKTARARRVHLVDTGE